MVISWNHTLLSIFSKLPGRLSFPFNYLPSLDARPLNYQTRLLGPRRLCSLRSLCLGCSLNFGPPDPVLANSCLPWERLRLPERLGWCLPASSGLGIHPVLSQVCDDVDLALFACRSPNRSGCLEKPASLVWALSAQRLRQQEQCRAATWMGDRIELELDTFLVQTTSALSWKQTLGGVQFFPLNSDSQGAKKRPLDTLVKSLLWLFCVWLLPCVLSVMFTMKAASL